MKLPFSLAFFGKLSKREKIIVVVAAAVAGIMISDRLVISPLLGTFGTMKTEMEDLKSSIEKSIRLLAQKDRIEKQLKEYASYSVQAKSPEEEAVALLRYVEDLSNKAGVNLLYAKPGGSKTEEKVMKYFVNLECEAQMGQMLAFFYDIENSDQLLKIEKFSLQPSVEGSSVSKSVVTVSRTVVQ